MSSSGFSGKEINANLGRHNIHAELDHSKLPQTGFSQTGVPLSTSLPQATNIASAIQTTALISNDPKTVVTQEQRIAANAPIITEKHVTQEFVPVVHEEIVTTVPVVTGSAVHTGQAIPGQTFVQNLGSQFIKQQALTKVDLIPEVSSQLGPQQVINIQSTSQPIPTGKATVWTSQQLLAQQQQMLAQQQQAFTQQTLGQQKTTVIQQPIIEETVTQTTLPVTTGFSSQTCQTTGTCGTTGINQSCPTGTCPTGMTQGVPMAGQRLGQQPPQYPGSGVGIQKTNF